MELNNTSLKIIDALYKKNEYMTVEEIMQELDLTERMVRYNVQKIEDFVLRKGYDFFWRDHGKGVKIARNEDSTNFYNYFLKNETLFEYRYSAEERLLYARLALLISYDYIKYSDVASKLWISTTTVKKDLKGVQEWFEKHNVEIITKPYVGVILQLDEMDRDTLIKDLIAEEISCSEVIKYTLKNEITAKINRLLLDEFFGLDEFDYILSQLIELESQLKKTFCDESFAALLIHVVNMVRRNKNDRHIGKETRSIIANTFEYLLASQFVEKINQKFSMDIGNEEINYLAIKILGSKVINHLDRDGYSNIDPEMLNLATVMTEEIEALYGISFGEKKDSVIRGLVAHLVPAVYRVQYKKQIINPMLSEITNRHQEIFEKTKIVSRNLVNYCKQDISDHEISYIAMHFMAAIHSVSKQERNQAKVIVVCGSGMATAQVISSQLTSFFDVEIIGVFPEREVYSVLKGTPDYDYIVSTIPLHNVGNDRYVEISPMLDKDDFSKLSKYFQAKLIRNDYSLATLEKAKKICELSFKYGVKVDINQLLFEILLLLTNDDLNVTNETTPQDNLADLLQPSLIRMNVDCLNWREAIAEGAKVLEEQGYVDEGYKRAIIDYIAEHGPHMVIVPGIVLSHTDPYPYCKKDGFSLIKLKRPIGFGHKNHDPVRVVITVSVVDKESQNNALLQLFKLFQNKEDRGKLIAATNKAEVLDLIAKYSQ